MYPKWNQKNGIITAYHKGIEVFRTTKYNRSIIRNKILEQGLSFLYEAIDEYDNGCLHPYKKQ